MSDSIQSVNKDQKHTANGSGIDTLKTGYSRAPWEALKGGHPNLSGCTTEKRSILRHNVYRYV
ncbi:MAG TPA: hypothetical protein PLO24_07820 [Bacteroidales bacterium]|nr:hypothetical protein [Bacteroidales bacterium]